MSNRSKEPTQTTGTPLPPLKAVRQECLSCSLGSPSEVRRCETKGCSLWPYRFGQKPTPELLAEVSDVYIYPLESNQKGSEVEGRSALKAIKSRCLECSGGSHVEVRECEFIDCDLYPYRLGESGRVLSPEQKEAAAARARALSE